MKKINLLLVAVVLIAIFFRFFHLGVNPPSLTWDEAAWGYNAYSLGIDGRDEFGKFLPYQYLESFGDFKPPMYAYLDILPIKFLGLNEFAVRFPSALFGVLTVLMTYFLVRRIFRKNHKSLVTCPPSAAASSDCRRVNHKSDKIALFSALFLAISPWHIMLSRAAFEANVATFFIVFGVWAFLAGVQNKKWYLTLSAISFALSIYTFNTARVVSPLLILILIVAFRKQLLKIKKQAIIGFLLGIIIVLPIAGFLLSPQAGLRFKEVNIFSDISIVKTANQEMSNDNNALWSKLIHNRRFLYSVEYVKHYFDNLSPSFLFIKGDGNPKFSVQNVGQMYIWDIPFFIAGLLIIFRKREGNWWLIPVWLVLGIIPAATARETPHALRIETTLPTFQILSAYGFASLVLSRKYFVLRIKKIRFFILASLYLLLFLNFTYFAHSYFAHYPREFSGEWQYGYEESINYVRSVESNYDIIQITNALGRPYIYYLFYLKSEPSLFRKTADIQRDPFGFVNVKSFGKYIFPTDYNYSLSKNSKVLYVNTPYNLPSNIKIKKIFYILNGQPVLVAYTL